MAVRQKYAVKVSLQGKLETPIGSAAMLLEFLRYAQVCRVDLKQLWIYPPTTVPKSAHRTWAEVNAQRIRSFGVDAKAVIY